MQLVLDTKNLTLALKGGAFEVIGEKSKRVISPGKLDSIAITSNITLESAAVKLAIKHQIPILFFDAIGKAKARLWSPYFASIATLRRQQVQFAETPEATALMIDLFALKLNGQIQNLKFLKNHSTRFGNSLDQATRQIRKLGGGFEQFRDKLPGESRQSMMGVEGSIARIYWQAIGSAVPTPYAFQQRSRRPAKDNFNATINYFYGMLYSVVEGSLFAVGLDPHLGIFHADEYAKPTFAFDLIEAFRPWVDQLLLEQCVAKKLDKAFFSKNQFGIFLNKHGKAFIIPLFNDYLRKSTKFLGQEATVKNHVYGFSARVAQRIRATFT